MEYGIITNPYKNTNKDRVYHIGDYTSISELNTKALEILGNPDNFRCIKTKAYEYSNFCCRGVLQVIQDGERRGDALVSSFMKFRENNTHVVTNEYSPAYRVNGQFVDLGRVLNGEPECMVDMFAEMSSNSKYLDIEFACSRPVYLNELKNKDYYVFSYYLGFLDLIDQWEQNGIRCKVTMIYNGINIDLSDRDSYINKDQYKGSLLLKDYQDVLDIKSFCVALFSENVLNCFLYLGYAITGKNPRKSTGYICPDSIDSKFVEYNYLKPEKIRIPSLFYPKFILKGVKTSAVNILKGLNYPLENY